MARRRGLVVVVDADDPRSLSFRARTASADCARPWSLQQHHDRRMDAAPGGIEPRHRLAATTRHPQLAHPRIQRRHVRFVQLRELPLDGIAVAMRSRPF